MLSVCANSEQTRITHSTVIALKRACVSWFDIVAFTIPINCFVTHIATICPLGTFLCVPNYQGVYSRQHNINITLDITLLVKTYSTLLHGREQ